MSLQKNKITEVPLSKLIFVALDIETTGLDPFTDRILEIAGIKFNIDGRDKGKLSLLVNPRIPIRPEVIRIHGISENMVKGKPTIREALHLLKNFIGDETILIFHNAWFDLAFLGKAFHDTHLPPPSLPVIDTLPLSQRYLSGKEGCSLQAVFRRVSNKTLEFHRAFDDSLAVKEIFIHLVRKLRISYLSEILKKKEIIFFSQGYLPGVQLGGNYAFINQAREKKTPLEIEYPEKGGMRRYQIIINEVIKGGKKIFLYASCLPTYQKKYFELHKIYFPPVCNF